MSKILTPLTCFFTITIVMMHNTFVLSFFIEYRKNHIKVLSNLIKIYKILQCIIYGYEIK